MSFDRNGPFMQIEYQAMNMTLAMIRHFVTNRRYDIIDF